MAKEKVKALAVWLSTDPDITISQNYDDKQEKMKATPDCWKFRTRVPLMRRFLGCPMFRRANKLLLRPPQHRAAKRGTSLYHRAMLKTLLLSLGADVSDN